MKYTKEMRKFSFCGDRAAMRLYFAADAAASDLPLNEEAHDDFVMRYIRRHKFLPRAVRFGALDELHRWIGRRF